MGLLTRRAVRQEPCSTRSGRTTPSSRRVRDPPVTASARRPGDIARRLIFALTSGSEGRGTTHSRPSWLWNNSLPDLVYVSCVSQAASDVLHHRTERKEGETMNIRSITVSSLLVLSLVACSRAAKAPKPVGPQSPTPGADASTPSPEPSVGESPLSPPPTPTPALPEQTSPLPDPESSPLEPPSGRTDPVVVAAKAHLAQELGVASDDIEVTAVEPVEWSDASLGCPEPGQSYAQVITPGYRIILRAQEERHEVHTDREGQIIVVCGPER